MKGSVERKVDLLVWELKRYIYNIYAAAISETISGLTTTFMKSKVMLSYTQVESYLSMGNSSQEVNEWGLSSALKQLRHGEMEANSGSQ